MRQFNAASCAWRALLLLIPFAPSPTISGKRSLQIKTHVAAIVARNTCNSSSGSSYVLLYVHLSGVPFKRHSAKKLQVKSALEERESNFKIVRPIYHTSMHPYSEDWLRGTCGNYFSVYVIRLFMYIWKLNNFYY